MIEGEGFYFVVQIKNPFDHGLEVPVELERGRFGWAGRTGPAITHYDTEWAGRPGFVKVGELNGEPILRFMA